MSWLSDKSACPYDDPFICLFKKKKKKKGRHTKGLGKSLDFNR